MAGRRTFFRSIWPDKRNWEGGEGKNTKIKKEIASSKQMVGVPFFESRTPIFCELKNNNSGLLFRRKSRAKFISSKRAHLMNNHRVRRYQLTVTERSFMNIYLNYCYFFVWRWGTHQFVICEQWIYTFTNLIKWISFWKCI